MSIKREAAYHEAGHAVVARLSRFHELVGPIDLAAYGAGEAYVSLSKSKCVANGVPPTPESARLPEVAKDLGRVLAAGLMAEQIAATHEPALTPNPACAEPDHKLLVQQLLAAGLSKKFDRLEAEAKTMLTDNWPIVAKVAENLFAAGGADASDIYAVIEDALEGDA